MTEEALLRLEEGLRAQREQREGRRFSEPDTVSSRPGAEALGKADDCVRTQIEAASEILWLPVPINQTRALTSSRRHSTTWKTAKPS